MKISSITAFMPQVQAKVMSRMAQPQKPQEIEIQVIEPEEGLWLTQVTCGEHERVFSDKAYLAQGSTPEEWTEWTTEQKEAYEAEEEAYREAEMKKRMENPISENNYGEED